MRLEFKVKVDRCISWRVTKGLPIDGDYIPGVLHLHVTPTRRKRHREIANGHSDKDKEHREPEVVPVHDYRGSLGQWRFKRVGVL